MSNNRFADLETFVAVAEVGTFTGAAARMGRSKTSVSRQVKSLEQRLGTRLLHRTTRSVSLTDTGAGLYERARAALADLDDAEASVADEQITPHGRFKVSLPVSFGTRTAAKPLLRVAQLHAGLELDLVFTDRFVDLVAEGFDLAVRVGSLADSSLIARRLCTTRRIVCVAPMYLEQRDPPAEPSDLMQHECLLYSQQAGGSAWRFADGLTVNAPGRVRADSGEALLDAAVAGMGVAWLPDFFVRRALAEGHLVPLLEAYEAEPVGIWALYPDRRYPSLKLRLMLDALTEDLASPPSV